MGANRSSEHVSKGSTVACIIRQDCDTWHRVLLALCGIQWPEQSDYLLQRRVGINFFFASIYFGFLTSLFLTPSLQVV